jgi:hypothetical protein
MANEKMAAGEREAAVTGTKKAWRKPVVSVVALRSTANNTGSGADGSGIEGIEATS